MDPAREWWRPSDVVWTRPIRVPFAPEAPASGIGDTGFHPSCWYRRRCELELYEGRKHGFFNDRGAKTGEPGEDFLATTERMDRFLESLGYVEGPPRVREFFEARAAETGR